MTPLKIKSYMIDRGVVTIADVCHHFLIDEALAAQLLSFWVRRQKCDLVKSCTDCHVKCQQTARYAWRI